MVGGGLLELSDWLARRAACRAALAATRPGPSRRRRRPGAACFAGSAIGRPAREFSAPSAGSMALGRRHRQAAGRAARKSARRQYPDRRSVRRSSSRPPGPCCLHTSKVGRYQEKSVCSHHCRGRMPDMFTASSPPEQWRVIPAPPSTASPHTVWIFIVLLGGRVGHEWGFGRVFCMLAESIRRHQSFSIDSRRCRADHRNGACPPAGLMPCSTCPRWPAAACWPTWQRCKNSGGERTRWSVPEARHLPRHRARRRCPRRPAHPRPDRPRRGPHPTPAPPHTRPPRRIRSAPGNTRSPVAYRPAPHWVTTRSRSPAGAAATAVIAVPPAVRERRHRDARWAAGRGGAMSSPAEVGSPSPGSVGDRSLGT